MHLDVRHHRLSCLWCITSRQPRQLFSIPDNPLAEYVAAFFLLRTNSAGWVDCLPAQSIEKRTLRWPERYERDAVGNWHDRASEAFASRFGLVFSIRVPRPEDAVVQRNLEFLDDYLRSPRTLRPEPETAALASLVRHSPGALRELLHQASILT